MNDIIEEIDGGIRSYGSTADPPGGFFDALASRHRRTILAVLVDEGEASVSRLANRVAARRRGGTTDDVPDPDRTDLSILLHHVHLPKLRETGLVEWDPDEGSVALVRDGPLERPEFDSIVRERDVQTPDEISTTLSLLTSRRRREILTVLKRRSADTPDAIARAVAANEFAPPVPDDSVSRILVDLHHVQVPKLVEAGVVVTDRDGRELVYSGNELLDDHGLLHVADDVRA